MINSNVINNHKELPGGVEMVLHEPPFRGEPLESAIAEFQDHYGYEPKTVYQINHQFFIVKERDG